MPELGLLELEKYGIIVKGRSEKVDVLYSLLGAHLELCYEPISQSINHQAFSSLSSSSTDDLTGGSDANDSSLKCRPI
jgi:hypothetical protein